MTQSNERARHSRGPGVWTFSLVSRSETTMVAEMPIWGIQITVARQPDAIPFGWVELNADAVLRPPGIPTGFRPRAQGCRTAATLGYWQTNISNRKAVAAHRYRSLVAHNAVGVDSVTNRAPKVGAGAPTSGWWPMPRWGSRCLPSSLAEPTERGPPPSRRAKAPLRRDGGSPQQG